METDNTYMYLSIVTFLAYATAIALAYLMFNDYRDQMQHPDVNKQPFSQHGAFVIQVDALT